MRPETRQGGLARAEGREELCAGGLRKEHRTRTGHRLAVHEGEHR
jgi:hypothetical protein